MWFASGSRRFAEVRGTLLAILVGLALTGRAPADDTHVFTELPVVGPSSSPGDFRVRSGTAAWTRRVSRDASLSPLREALGGSTSGE